MYRCGHQLLSKFSSGLDDQHAAFAAVHAECTYTPESADLLSRHNNMVTDAEFVIFVASDVHMDITGCYCADKAGCMTSMGSTSALMTRHRYCGRKVTTSLTW